MLEEKKLDLEQVMTGDIAGMTLPIASLKRRNPSLTEVAPEGEKAEEFIQKNIVRASTTKQAQSRRKMLEKMVILEKPEKEKKVHFEFEFTKSFNVPAITTKTVEKKSKELIVSFK